MYPTKEEILAGEFKHKKEVLRLAKEWKRTDWAIAKNLRADARFNALGRLLYGIAEIYGKPVERINVGDGTGSTGASYYCGGRIFLAGRPSIITALHEMGHHLFGPDELRACRWSVHLFRKVFPRSYARMRWDGHMLVRALSPEEQAVEDEISATAEHLYGPAE